MKLKTWLLGFAAIAIASSASYAADLPFNLVNRFRLEYDDNYDESDTDAQSSAKVIDELEVMFDLNMQQTFVGLNIRPSIIWWQDRPDDSTDFNVYADLILNQEFSRRVALNVKNTLMRSENPELTENGETYREDGTFWYNNLDGSLSFMLRPKTYLDVDMGYALMRYDKNEPSKRNDYDKIGTGVNVRHQLLPETELSFGMKYASLKYNESDTGRDADTIGATFGVQHMFSPNLLSSAKLGMDVTDAKSSFGEDKKSPSADLGLTYLPSPATRLSVGASYSILETDVYPYSYQQRMMGFASASYDITAKLTLTVAGSYAQSEYDADALPTNATVGDLPSKEQARIMAANSGVTESTVLTQSYVDSVSDQSESTMRLNTSLSYQLNRMNWLELGWRFTQMDSDLREDYDRNLLHAGWKVKL